MNNYYIRIGEIPSDERSYTFKGENIIGKEDGVSVYDCIENDGKYHIVMPLPMKGGQGKTYECLIQSVTECHYKIDNPLKVYLVTGDKVGIGIDNEPVIRNVRIIKDITYYYKK